jgi:hypothetical protein
MNALWTRFLKKTYRKEPMSSFIVIFGIANSVIGGLNERWTLMSLGITIILLGSLVRWWQIQKNQAILAKETPIKYLPPTSSRPPLPMLTSEKNRR